MMLFIVQTKSLVHKVYPGGGSCFATPCVDPTAGLVYCATLQGDVAAINTVRCVVKAHLLESTPVGKHTCWAISQNV